MAVATRMYNPNSMGHAVGYEGVSWTCLFFGPFPALFRADWLGFLVMLVSAMFTMGFSNVIFMFIYNGWHYNRLLAAGYQPGTYGLAASNQVNVVNVNLAEDRLANVGQSFQPKASKVPQFAHPHNQQVQAFGQRQLHR